MQRDQYFDIIKGIAVIMMVLGHSIEYGGGLLYRDSGDYFNNPLFLVIYSFHMPLFMMVSGYFYYFTSSRRDCLSILKNKLRTLFVPVLFFALFNSVLAFQAPFSAGGFVWDYIHRLPNTLWFLWNLLIFTGIKLLQNKLKMDNVVADFVIAVMLCLVPNQPLGAFLAYMYPFFCIGYYVNKKGYMTMFEHNIKQIMATSTLLFVVLLCFFNSEYLVYDSGTCFFSDNSFVNQCEYNLFRLIIGVSGSISIASIVKFVELSFKRETNLGKCLAHVGVLSMGIYCFQDIALCLYHHFTRDIAQPTFGYWTCAFVSIFAMCLVLTLFTKSIRLLNRLLLGGR